MVRDPRMGAARRVPRPRVLRRRLRTCYWRVHRWTCLTGGRGRRTSWRGGERGGLLNTTENAVLDRGDTVTIIRANSIEESEMGNKISGAMEAISKQYAPDEDTAWVWMRKANDAGWTWGMHGHRVPGAQATTSIVGFSNGDGVYVGITIFAGKVWWSWFTGEEWGPGGRALCLSGHRARHETPIAAIAEYELSQGCNGELDYEIHDVGQLKDANS